MYRYTYDFFSEIFFLRTANHTQKYTDRRENTNKVGKRDKHIKSE